MTTVRGVALTRSTLRPGHGWRKDADRTIPDIAPRPHTGGPPVNAYVIPLASDGDRVPPDGRLRVYETRDAGASWAERGEGLPQEDAYLTILRQAFDRSGDGSELELYFGATSGDLFGSGDAGASWFTVATHLPPVYSVRAQ